MQRGLKVPSIAKRSSLASAQVNTHTHTQRNAVLQILQSSPPSPAMAAALVVDDDVTCVPSDVLTPTCVLPILRRRTRQRMEWTEGTAQGTRSVDFIVIVIIW